MSEPPSNPIVAPKVVLDDIIEFSESGPRLRFGPRGGEERYIELDSWLVNSVFDYDGKALYGGVGCPVDARDVEYGGLQILFSNQVTYVGPDRGTLRFMLMGGKCYDKTGHPSDTLNLRYKYVRALYDRSTAKVWENTGPREPDA